MLAATDSHAFQASKYLVYVGTYTDSGSQGIYVYRYDAASGGVTPLGLAAESVNPSFLAVSSDHKFLYAVNETGEHKGQKNSGGLSAYRIDRATGKLILLNEVSSAGADPCYLSLDKTGKFLLVANYTGGSVAVFPVEKDGRLGERTAFVQHQGKGVNPERQEGPHAHWISVTPDNQHVLSADLGLDEIHLYKFDATKGTLREIAPAKLSPGSGPRHVAISANSKFVYVLSEIKSTLTTFAYDEAAGTLKEIQALSTLPADFQGANDTAEVQLDPSGKFLYASNRGENSIVVYEVDSAKGTLSFLQRVSTGGREPRHFTLDPAGKRLLAANQIIGNIVTMQVEGGSGKLTPAVESAKVSKPVCIVFVPEK